MRPERLFAGVIAVVITVVLAVAASAAAQTITVTTTLDTVANDGHCSLREALDSAATDTPSGGAAGECRAGAGADTIVLGAGRFVLSRTGAGEDANATGDLDVIGGTVTVRGAGPAATKVDASHLDRVFDVLTGAALTLQKLTITGGRLPVASPGGPGLNGADGTGQDSVAGDGLPGAGGGGVRSAGALTIANVVITDNRAGDGGLGGNSLTGGSGGLAANGNGETGGTTRGGAGGDGGDGGGVLSTAGVTIISDSTFTDDVAGNGGIAGSATAGGTGGASQGNGTGGNGGACFAGHGGTGGSGGAIDSESGTLAIARSDIEHNTAGSGGAGGPCGHGGTGGAGAGSGNGGPGGFAFGGSGGPGGDGGGVSAHATALTLTASTIASNRSGDGANGSGTATGGNGGNGGATGSGGGGNFMAAGGGGEGGGGGGVLIRSTNAGSANGVLRDDALIDNQAGKGGNGGDGSSGGTGGRGDAGNGSVGTSGDSDGGGGGEAGEGAGVLFDAEFSASDLTVTGNRTSAGGNGGAGGNGPSRSTGGGGGGGGFGGGVLAEEGSLSHVTMVGNAISRGGTGGAAGSGVNGATPGFSEGLGLGADLAASGSEQPLVSVSASIISGCEGALANGGGDIAVAAAERCPGILTNPRLGPLAANGGPTKTIALLAGSPAIDRIAVPCGTTPDQRGVARPQGRGCDAGAYEFAPPGTITGAASHVSATRATVAGVIVSNARATTWHVEYGRTKRYGKRTPSHTIAGGLAPVVVSATLTGLPRHTALHYRIVAANGDGTSRGADHTLTTSGFGGVTVVKLKLTASASGVVPVTVACPAGTASPCRGTLSMSTTVKAKHGRAKAVALAHASFKISAGSRKAVHLKLGSKGRSLLHAAGGKGLAVTLTAVARDAHGTHARSSFSATLNR